MSATATTLRLLWPFLKEMILGDKTVLQALKTNKMRVLLLFLILGSFALNFMMLPRTFEISSQFVELQKEHNALKELSAGSEQLSAERDSLKADLATANAALKDTRQQLRSTQTRETLLGDQLKQCQDTSDHQPSCPAPLPARPNQRYELFREQFEKMRKEET